MKVWKKESEAFLYKYLNNTSPTGFETSGQKVWLDYLKPYLDEWHIDHYGTAYGVINPGQEFSVVIEAHADEISWFVNYISDDGFISVIRNGGSDHIIAPSKSVNIHTPKGIVRGVFGWPAIHVRHGKDANLSPSLENIFVDVGAKNKEDVEKMGVHIGNVITFDDELQCLNDAYYCGRALDNRIGGWAIAQVGRLLKENKKSLPFTLYIVNAVQEEVGLRGAEMIAARLKPNVAIVTDVCHDTGTPLMKPKEQGDIKAGKGPVLTYAPAIHYNVLNVVVEAAESAKIPFQRSASSRSTGTDTDAFAYSNGGVPSVLISLPLRYMHTTVEMAHKDDIENLVKLMYESILKIDPKMSLKYF
jgi:putative aminopeptidase FrvX